MYVSLVQYHYMYLLLIMCVYDPFHEIVTNFISLPYLKELILPMLFCVRNQQFDVVVRYSRKKAIFHRLILLVATMLREL